MGFCFMLFKHELILRKFTHDTRPSLFLFRNCAENTSSFRTLGVKHDAWKA